MLRKLLILFLCIPLTGAILPRREAGGGGSQCSGSFVTCDVLFDEDATNATSWEIEVDGTGADSSALDVAEDELMLGIWCIDASSSAETCPSGWTEVLNETGNGGTPSHIICYKIASASDATATGFTANGGGTGQEFVGFFYNFANATSVSGTSLLSETATTSPTSPAHAGATTGSIIVRGFCNDSNAVTTEDANFASECDGNFEFVKESSSNSGAVGGGACVDGVEGTDATANNADTWDSVMSSESATGFTLEVLD